MSIASPTRRSSSSTVPGPVSIINNIYNLNIKINEYETDKHVNKTLTTIFDTNSTFQLPDVKEQIIEMKNYTL